MGSQIKMFPESIYILKGYKVYTGHQRVKRPEFYETRKFLNARQIAEMYKPILYKHTGPKDPYPEALYNRIIVGDDPETEEPAICIQYFGYWPVQVLLPSVIQHIYDYEPILVFLRKIRERPYKIVFSGGSYHPLKGFHWTEVYAENIFTPHEYIKNCDLPLRCVYPFSPKEGSRINTVTQHLKAFSITELLDQGSKKGNFHGNRLKLAVTSDFHAYSHDVSGDSIVLDQIPLRELTDEVLTQWYKRFLESQVGIKVEPFKHDVSDPMSDPYIKYKREVDLTEIKLSPQARKIGKRLAVNIEVSERAGPITKLSSDNFQVKINGTTTRIIDLEETMSGVYKGTVTLYRPKKESNALSITVKDNLGMLSSTLTITC